ncbi:hypothetical protein CA13_03120 [Planctomycetes bacterium CA13]|uniref:Uncharacterized protein n=1 Tax=Novipirellula herctigrandis TaxID=2527986 RepID=A0A5C5YVB3_9BACT|nr:hypothetical protein CA13_03120 [Planctomycetes bacterium CA13]
MEGGPCQGSLATSCNDNRRSKPSIGLHRIRLPHSLSGLVIDAMGWPTNYGWYIKQRTHQLPIKPTAKHLKTRNTARRLTVPKDRIAFAR